MSTEDLTVLLHRWEEGDSAALEALMPLVYSELHKIATGYMRHERDDHTLQPTALVNETYLRLLSQRRFAASDRRHFFVFAAKVMRNILKDHARSYTADKRGGKGQIRLPLSEEMAWVGNTPEQIIDLDKALTRLEALDRRKAQLVDLRFFLALDMADIASTLNISLATAERDLRFSRNWLYCAMYPESAGDGVVSK